jgi:hypothetical protein
MPNPEAVLRERIETSWRNSANCRELAGKALSAEDRYRWLTMSKFWVDRAKAAEMEQVVAPDNSAEN